LVESRDRSAKDTKIFFQEACIFHCKTVNILLKIKYIFDFQQTPIYILTFVEFGTQVAKKSSHLFYYLKKPVNKKIAVTFK